MERKDRAQDQKGASPWLSLGKCVLAAWLLTGGLLLLLALLYYRFRFPVQVINIAIIAVYALCSLLAGLFSGKCMQERKFLWGLLCGALYFIVLLLLSLGVNHGLKDVGTHFFTTMMVCCFSGMLGGMLS